MWSEVPAKPQPASVDAYIASLPDDLALDAIGDIVAAVPMQRWIEISKSVRGSR